MAEVHHLDLTYQQVAAKVQDELVVTLEDDQELVPEVI
jgi:hypothetical protein